LNNSQDKQQITLQTKNHVLLQRNVSLVHYTVYKPLKCYLYFFLHMRFAIYIYIYCFCLGCLVCLPTITNYLFVCLMVFNVTFNNISAISRWSVLLVENHRPVASRWQTVSHNVVHLAQIIWLSNLSILRVHPVKLAIYILAHLTHWRYRHPFVSCGSL
jgi:hypothetical protein